ncbi:hypothetical protein FisN_8Lh095 [Fistulifera solaris]|uniref:Uncharacterized protein n=1 Tax=Fistulifera solaris TaxID=1519565 RepID=A0A1Z5JE20_FISSO|nr:hypothetical protein FisN_8Lh095 [Fistulifera solaris]|eukprot:GAX12001.1 hypothetical protein FisN_8Lh095 [Fistulifera solaris]
MPRTTDLKKKQFGQNLNKLVVKPPPVVGSGSGVQRNGLLLLSATKKEGGLLSTPSVDTNAGAAAKLHESMIVSTHDALLSAVTGKVERDSKQLDAWGVADKQETEPLTHPPAPTAAPEIQEVKVTETIQAESTKHNETSGLNWDDYGGRETDSNRQLKQVTVDGDLDQQAYMSKLAKERAARLNTEELMKKRENEIRSAARLKELDDRKEKEAPAITRSIWEPKEPNRGENLFSGQRNHQNSYQSGDSSISHGRQSEGPVIHLSSYEDRDRGESQLSSGPRMLYDPKSGSMIAVKIPEEKKKQLVRKPKKDKKLETREDLKKPLKIKKETSKQQGKKFPRTCGVLYERDALGQIRCADGCEGDLGYGAHSVPGGKVKNPDAYAELMKAQDAENGTSTYNSRSLQLLGLKGSNMALQTGLMGTHDDHESNLLAMNSFDLVTADDKLELVTGVDDSPTLKPTAKEWAPSQAAIAAIVASRSKNPEPFEDSDDEEEEDDGYLVDGIGGGGDDGPLGLGFDPTQDMDGLMRSPPRTAEDTDQLAAAVDLESLKIDPPIFSLSSQGGPLSAQSNIFAFGTSSTWGTKSGDTNGDDWAMPTGISGAGAGLFGGMNAFAQNKNDPTGHTSPFLGGGTWTAPTQR